MKPLHTSSRSCLNCQLQSIKPPPIGVQLDILISTKSLYNPDDIVDRSCVFFSQLQCQKTALYSDSLAALSPFHNISCRRFIKSKASLLFVSSQTKDSTLREKSQRNTKKETNEADTPGVKYSFQHLSSVMWNMLSAVSGVIIDSIDVETWEHQVNEAYDFVWIRYQFTETLWQTGTATVILRNKLKGSVHSVTAQLLLRRFMQEVLQLLPRIRNNEVVAVLSFDSVWHIEYDFITVTGAMST